MKNLFPFLIALLLTAMTACAPQVDVEVDAEAEKEAIRGVVDDVVAAVNRGKASELAALFTEDAMRMPPNGPSSTDRKAVETQYQALFDRSTVKVILEPREIEVTGDWAYMWGTYDILATPKDGGDAMKDVGKFLDILRKQPDGTWQYHRHIWNADAPPTTVAKE